MLCSSRQESSTRNPSHDAERQQEGGKTRRSERILGFRNPQKIFPSSRLPVHPHLRVARNRWLPTDFLLDGGGEEVGHALIFGGVGVPVAAGALERVLGSHVDESDLAGVAVVRG